MTYPYIGEDKDNGNITLFTNENKGVVVKNKAFELGSYSNHWAEFTFKNITREYLSNTYGEVKSKEHAEFIKLLAETNDIPCAVLSIDMNYTMFYVIDGCLFFCVKDIDAVGDYKKIIIPLPPESNVNTPEEDFEMTQIAKNNEVTINVKNSTDSVVQVTKCEDERVVHITINEPPKNSTTYTYCDLVQDAERLRKTMEAINKYDAMKNNGDNLMFGDADKCEEWPCVNDEVQTNFGKGVVKLLPDVKGCYVIDINGNYHQLKHNELSKPKTPEEELRGELAEEFCTVGYDNEKYITALLKKYNITKKPQ